MVGSSFAVADRVGRLPERSGRGFVHHKANGNNRGRDYRPNLHTNRCHPNRSANGYSRPYPSCHSIGMKLRVEAMIMSVIKCFDVRILMEYDPTMTNAKAPVQVFC